MKCLDEIDALVRECQEFPYPALIKPLLTLRAQIALDVAEERLRLDVLLGHSTCETRYVQTAPGTYECQGRSSRFDRYGEHVETSEWAPLSTISNVPDELVHLLK